MISFDIPGVDLVIHDVVGGNTRRLEALIELFVELFPEYSYAVPRRRQKAALPANANPLFIDHQWLIDINGQAAAMADFKYAPQRDVGLGIYIAIRPAYRKIELKGYRRFSELLHIATWEQLKEDAAMAGNSPPLGLVVEVGSPKLVARYREYGFMELPIEYHEPRLRQGNVAALTPDEIEKIEFRQGSLGVFPLTKQQLSMNDSVLLSNAALAFLVDHYELPENHWAVQRALDAIKCHCVLEEGEE